MGCLLTRFSAFLRSFLAFLHSSLYQTVLFFTTLSLLLGMVSLAMSISMFVNVPIGLSVSRMNSILSRELVLLEKAFQSALESFQLLFV